MATWSLDVVFELDVPEPPPPVPTCQELGRATRAYVSAYDRSRVHQSRLYRFEKRCFVANFNGALPPGRTIATATWRIDAPEIGVISNPQISDDGRESSVMFASQLGGWANMRCEVTLDNGEIYNQVFRVNVREASWFFNDPPSQSGPFSVTVTASNVPGSDRVALSDHTILGMSNSQYFAGVRLRSTGELDIVTTANHAANYSPVSGEWLLDGSASDFEVRLTVVSGDSPFGGGTENPGSWLSLSSDRVYWMNSFVSAPTTLTGEWLLEIRDASTQTVLASCALYVTAVGSS